MDQILSAISTVGFPIVACGAMFYYIDKMDKRHSDEVGQLREVINNNTEALISSTSMTKAALDAISRRLDIDEE